MEKPKASEVMSIAKRRKAPAWGQSSIINCQKAGGYQIANLDVEVGKTIENIDLHFGLVKKGIWKNYIQADGLADIHAYSFYQD